MNHNLCDWLILDVTKFVFGDLLSLNCDLFAAKFQENIQHSSDIE